MGVTTFFLFLFFGHHSELDNLLFWGLLFMMDVFIIANLFDYILCFTKNNNLNLNFLSFYFIEF